eukprot:TRINITY_DN22975_c0_g1_i1.p1 TRINITY_DN22975_c0_g1~~TRINITY_DN22975_c0_g1_i1.p1  ORF type:complete len:275 (+),score=36.13 TRINITY_DN22975_c0_g1_i1:26-826(+)
MGERSLDDRTRMMGETFTSKVSNLVVIMGVIIMQVMVQIEMESAKSRMDKLEGEIVVMRHSSMNDQELSLAEGNEQQQLTDTLKTTIRKTRLIQICGSILLSSLTAQGSDFTMPGPATLPQSRIIGRLLLLIPGNLLHGQKKMKMNFWSLETPCTVMLLTTENHKMRLLTGDSSQILVSMIKIKQKEAAEDNSPELEKTQARPPRQKAIIAAKTNTSINYKQPPPTGDQLNHLIGIGYKSRTGRHTKENGTACDSPSCRVNRSEDT